MSGTADILNIWPENLITYLTYLKQKLKTKKYSDKLQKFAKVHWTLNIRVKFAQIMYDFTDWNLKFEALEWQNRGPHLFIFESL